MPRLLHDLDGGTVWRDILNPDPKRLSKSQPRTAGEREEKPVLRLPRTCDNPRNHLAFEGRLLWVFNSRQVYKGVIPIAGI
jgi:hypothetical protein